MSNLTSKQYALMRLLCLLASLALTSAVSPLDTEACLRTHSPNISLIHQDEASSNPLWDRIRYGELMQVDYEPMLIVLASRVEDVQASVLCSSALNIPVVPRNGGHSFAGHSSTDGGILLYMAGFNKMINVDKERGFMSVESGATLGQVYGYIHKTTNGEYGFGGGTEPSVGLTGHIVCVGYGPMGRLTGATMDQVAGFEVVTAEGKVVAANLWENRDLFFALKGSCMSAFGIVTRLNLKLTKVPPRVTYISTAVDNIEDSVAIYKVLFPFTALEAPPLYTLVFGMGHGGHLNVDSLYLGSLAEAKSVLEPVLAKIGNISTPFDFAEMSHFDAVERWAGRNESEWESSYLTPLEGRRKRVCHAGYFETVPTEAQIRGLYASFQDDGVHSSQIKLFGGNVNKPDVVRPFGIWMGRSAMSSYHHCITFTDEAERTQHLSSIEAFQTNWESNSTSIRQCVSYIEDQPNWKQNLYGKHWETLVAIKTKWDPMNVFHANDMSVDPLVLLTANLRGADGVETLIDL